MGTIADRNHRLTVCSMKDTVENGEMMLGRNVAYSGWAKITPKRSSRFSKDGAAIQQSRDTKTHEICMNYRYDVDITAAAWLYEKFIKSPPRWFKILSVTRMDDEWMFDCRLVEQGEDITPPNMGTTTDGIAVPLPSGVVL